MFRVEGLVEDKPKTILPRAFGLVFDGWSSHGTHFCGVFATFVNTELGDVINPLLAFSPIGDETAWTAAAHVTFLTETLEVFGKSVSSVAFLVGGNCSTNQAIATQLSIPFVGCASH